MLEYRNLTTIGALRDLLNQKKTTLPDNMKIMILRLDGKGYQPFENAVVASDIRDKKISVFYLDNDSYDTGILNMAGMLDKIENFLARRGIKCNSRSQGKCAAVQFLKDLMEGTHEST